MQTIYLRELCNSVRKQIKFSNVKERYIGEKEGFAPNNMLKNEIENCK